MGSPEAAMTPFIPSRHSLRLLLGCTAAVFGLSGRAMADDPAKQDPHANCEEALTTPARDAVRNRYLIPDVALVRADGTQVKLRQELDDGRPVILNFIFTTCTSICPVMTQTFVQIQKRLGDDRSRVHMVSVSIDPEEDTPARLREYAKKFGAGPQWTFYTGTQEASVALQKAFDIYRGDKMNHVPVTFLRIAPGQPWVRIEGLARADAVVREYRQLVAAR
jgi:protein SCO1